MTKKEDGYKKGKDFEMRKVTGKDGKVLHTTRHFFTKAEKEAAKKPPVVAKPATKAPKPVKASSAPTPKAKPKAKPDNTKEVVSRASAAIDRATKGGTVTGGATGRWEAPNKTAPKPTSKPVNKLSGVTESEWDAMSRPERSGKGLPVSWIDYVKAGGDAVVKKPKPVVAKAPNRMEAFKLQQKK